MISMEEQLKQLQQKYDDLDNRLSAFLDVYYRTNFPDKMVLTKKLVLQNQNIDTEGTVGMKIGNSASKLSVYGVAPVVQASAISSPSGGATIDSQARTAIDSIRVAIKNYGITQ